MRKKILSLLTGALMFASVPLTSFAQTVEISIVEKPNIDILLTTGDFTSDLTNFERDIRNSLEQDGINTSGIDFQAIETSVTSTDAMDATTIFNEWGRIGLNGTWKLDKVDNKTSIWNTENTAGITGFYCKDNYNFKNMTIEFDTKTTDGDNDAIGVFLRFNLTGGTNDSTANASKKATTYLYTEEIGADKHVLPNGLYKITNQLMAKDSQYSTYVNNGSYKLLQSPKTTTNALTMKTWKHYQFIVKKNNIKVYRSNVDGSNKVLVIDYTDPNPIEMGSFGLMNWSQPSAFANFTAACETERNYSEVLTEPTWREDATHMIVNVDSSINTSITENAESLTRTLSDDVHFIQWGDTANKSAFETFIKKNDNKGLFTLGAKAADYQTGVQNTVNYIESLIDKKDETQYVIVGRDAELAVEPEEYKTNASNIEFPNGRWIIHHDYKYFDNNLGQSAQTESYTPDLLLNFDKPGAYNIYFDDMLVKTVYAHRLPVADFIMEINGNNLTLTSNSYDEDKNTDNGFGKGIAKETWYYKKSTDTNWTEGKLTKIDPQTVYIIKLEVEDMQGATSYTTKYTGVGNPVASFIADKSSFSKYYNLKLTNTSYDPVGYDISSYKWELKNGKTVVKTYTEKEPVIDFKTLGAGTYSLSLSVTNTQGTKSESYTRSLTVLEDTTPPSITVDPTYSDWTDSQDINISIEDTGSGLKQWRYVYTQSQDKPADSAYGAWQTNAEESLHFDTDGEYYLHIQAVDVAGNSITRTVGSYKITHPYTNKVINDYGVISKTDFVTFDWGKWYNPTTEFEVKVKGFELKDTFMANYPTAGTIYNKTDRLKQPSGVVEYNFSYQPTVYTATIDYGYDEKVETKDFTVLKGFSLEKPVRENYEFIGWYVDDTLVNNINYNLDNNFETFEEFTKALESRYSNNITIKARWNQSEFNEGVNVYAQIASEYKVTIPKTVVLSGKSKAAQYFVKVEGDIAGYEDVTVTPDEVFDLHTSGKDAQEATVEQDKTTWKVSDFDTDANGTIKADGITAGSWQGNFNFNISFNGTDGDNVNSKEEIEYITVEYPQHFDEGPVER